MTIKEAIAQTQRRWVYFATGEGDSESCGFCEAACGCCGKCTVAKVLGKECGNLHNYCEWDRADEQYGPWHPKTKEAARAVLEDVNKIARAYHCKVAPLPPTPGG